MRATYDFSTTNYRYEIYGFEYAVQRLEDKFCKKALHQIIQFDKVTLEGVLAWSRGDARAAVEKILEQPDKKNRNYDWAKDKIFQNIYRKAGKNEPEFRRLMIELAKRIEKDEKKYGKRSIPQIIYGNSD